MRYRREFLKLASVFGVGLAASSEKATAQSVSDQSEKVQPTQATPPSVEEKHFTNYHLLGEPDPSTNLLGAVRPHDWPTTKADLVKALHAEAQDADPIHRWLQTFTLSFDDRASSIILAAAATVGQTNNPFHFPPLYTPFAARPRTAADLTYEPQLYDGLLRSASALLDRCLRYRNEMGSFELAGVNAAINYLTFLKLKPLQRNFLIQSSSADIAEIERAAQAGASHWYGAASGVDKLFDGHQMHGLQVEASGGAAEAELSGAKDRLRTSLLERQFNLQVDAQLAQFTRLLSSGSASNVAERYLRMLALLTEDLADAFRKLYSASKGVQGVLGLTTITVGNGPAVGLDIPRFSSADDLAKWVRQIVPTTEGDARKPDGLDALVLWTRAVMRQIDWRGQYETELTMSIPLNQPWGKNNTLLVSQAAITAALSPKAPTKPTGQVTFTLSDDILPFRSTPQHVRVIGVGLSVEGLIDDASPVQYATDPRKYNSTADEPTSAQVQETEGIEKRKMGRLSATVLTPAQTVPGVGQYWRPALFLANIRFQGGAGGDLEPGLSFDSGCHNLSPFGAWTVSFDQNVLEFFQTATQLGDLSISGLILHLRLRGSAA
jgi:hypothetical protein